MSFAIRRRDALVALAGFGPNAAAQSGPLPADTLNRLLTPPNGKARVVIDTDAYNEIDDQYAIVYGLLSPGRMDVEAIYAAPFLNDRAKSAADGMEQSYKEILRLLKLLGRGDPSRVLRGSERFLQRAGAPIESPAMKDLIARAMQPRQSPLYVLTLGCPVNVSSAILAEPRIREKIVVVWLGGTNHEWPSAREFNLRQDVLSSQVLFDSGVPLVQIPTKNVSEHLRTTVPEARHWLEGRNKLCDYLFGQFVEYHNEHTKGKPQPYAWSKVIWDISVIAWMANPEWVPSRIVPSPVLTADMRWEKGAGRHSIRVATDVHRDPVFHDLFAKLAKAGR